MSAVEQLENGVRVQCADGTVVVCKPLMLKRAKEIMALWNTRFTPRPVLVDPAHPTDAEQVAVAAWATSVARARIQMVELFGTL